MPIGTSRASTASGTTLSVSAAEPATYDAAGFAALTWTEIGEVTSIGGSGKTYQIVTHQPLATRNTFKRKGSYDNGDISIGMAVGVGDPGQDILEDALESDESFYFRIEEPTGRIRYIPGQVSQLTDDDIGSTDTILTQTVQIAIDGDILKVLPTP